MEAPAHRPGRPSGAADAERGPSCGEHGRELKKLVEGMCSEVESTLNLPVQRSRLPAASVAGGWVAEFLREHGGESTQPLRGTEREPGRIR